MAKQMLENTLEDFLKQESDGKEKVYRITVSKGHVSESFKVKCSDMKTVLLSGVPFLCFHEDNIGANDIRTGLRLVNFDSIIDISE